MLYFNYSFHCHNGLASEDHSVAPKVNPHNAAPLRGLECGELVFFQSDAPVRPEEAVSGAGDRIFLDSRRWREKARQEIKTSGFGKTSHNHAAGWKPRKRVEVWSQGSQGLFRTHFNQVIEPA